MHAAALKLLVLLAPGCMFMHPPDTTRTNAILSRWRGSMLACSLNTKPLQNRRKNQDGHGRMESSHAASTGTTGDLARRMQRARVCRYMQHASRGAHLKLVLVGETSTPPRVAAAPGLAALSMKSLRNSSTPKLLWAAQVRGRPREWSMGWAQPVVTQGGVQWAGVLLGQLRGYARWGPAEKGGWEEGGCGGWGRGRLKAQAAPCSSRGPT